MTSHNKPRRGSDGNPIVEAAAKKNVDPHRPTVDAKKLQQQKPVTEDMPAQVYKGANPRNIASDPRTIRASSRQKVDKKDANIDEVVGWLVVITGEGRGHSLQVNYGNNRLGRSADADIPLDFGDQSISRTSHCNIIYEPKTRKFYLQPGDGKNLTYVGGEVILATRELFAHDAIQLGDTTLVFVALCGDGFSWEEHPVA